MVRKGVTKKVVVKQHDAFKHSKDIAKRVVKSQKVKSNEEFKGSTFDVKSTVERMRGSIGKTDGEQAHYFHTPKNLVEHRKAIVDTGGETPPNIRRIKRTDKFYKTGISGLDELLVEGIPHGASVLICGGTGSGKTILNLELVANACKRKMKCLYLTLEESEERLIDHMADFNWDVEKYVKEGNLMFSRLNPFDITRNVDALLAREKGELLIDVKPVILPEGFTPDIIVFDSLTAIAGAFVGRQDTYRIYIEKLFRYFEEIGSTNFLISETDQIPKRFSPSGTEEFLADGVIILYSIQKKDQRVRAIEVLKMRGVDHKRRVVELSIKRGEGIVIEPSKQVSVTE